MLNYAYAALEGQVRIQLTSEGYDPTIGFMHASAPGRDAFVLDLMEPMRPVVDRKILEFVQSHTFHPADFTIRSDGVCRINPEMARSVVSTLIPTISRVAPSGLLGHHHPVDPLCGWAASDAAPAPAL
jgi:CRISPR-associated protein Cas1